MTITIEMCKTIATNYIIKDNITVMIYVKYSLVGIANKGASQNCTVNDTTDMNLNASNYNHDSHIAIVLQLVLVGLKH